ncbi:MAG: leucyl/phenylalanyl-tRNA--protein transferase [Bacteroidota bacterium]
MNRQDNGIKLDVGLLIAAYRHGYFPMWTEEYGIQWHYPDPRAIIPFENYKPSKSLRPVLNKKEFEIRIDTSFEEVMRQCAQPRGAGDGVWISEEMIQVYTAAHRLGFAHSVETYRHGELVGGLYGMCVGGVFFGESMFSKVSNSSKVAFHYLIQILVKNGFQLLDTQYINDNVERYGAVEVPRDEFLRILKSAIDLDCRFTLDGV